MKTKKTNTVLILLVLTALVVVGCQGLRESGVVTKQSVPVVTQAPDGTLSTNIVPVDALSPEFLAAARAAGSFLPPPWGELLGLALGGGAAGYLAFQRYQTSKKTPSNPGSPPPS